MIICSCLELSEHTIQEAIRCGLVDLEQLKEELGVARQCGCCEGHLIKLINDYQRAQGSVGKDA